MVKANKISFLAILLIPLLFLTGCWDQREIEQRASIMAISFDKGEKEGEYRISVQIPIPLKIAGGSEGGGGGGKTEEAIRIITVNATSVSDAQRKIQNQVNYNLFFGHTRAIIFSDKLAAEGLENILGALRNKPDIRRSAMPMIVKDGEALDLLKFSPKLEQIPMIYIKTMIENEINAERLPDSSLGRFFIDLSHPAKEPRMVVFNVEKNKLSIHGLALFKNYRLLGYLTEEEMFNWLRISKQNKGGIISMNSNDNNNSISITPDQVDTESAFYLKNGNVNIDIDVSIDGTLEEMPNIDDLNKQRSELEKKMEEHLTEHTKEIITKAQNELNIDIFNFGEKIRAFKYRSIWKKIDWKKDFPYADISVKYHVTISRTNEVAE